MGAPPHSVAQTQCCISHLSFFPYFLSLTDTLKHVRNAIVKSSWFIHNCKYWLWQPLRDGTSLRKLWDDGCPAHSNGHHTFQTQQADKKSLQTTGWVKTQFPVSQYLSHYPSALYKICFCWSSINLPTIGHVQEWSELLPWTTKPVIRVHFFRWIWINNLSIDVWFC